MGQKALGSYECPTGSLPLEFTENPLRTKMYGHFVGMDAFRFQNHNYTWNSHHWGVGPQTFIDDKAL